MKFINLKNMSEEEHISSESILCLGNFDGVHIGHRQLVASLFDQYTSLKTQFPSLCTGVWLFDSSSYKQVHEIYSLNEKLNVFANLGLDYAVVADFNEMKSLSPDQFVKDILKSRCNCIYAICGENFKFGSKAVGDSNTLKELMIGQATIVSLLSIDDDQNFESPIIVSSTLIRSLLSKGDISKANFLLSDKYSITEEVIHGKALGRTIGIPTINQIPSTKQLILKRVLIINMICIIGDITQLKIILKTKI
jgi:riboflavin kinase/FMN adenylyltransferase